jgi:NitT/TauT family transport system permease protein
MTFHSSARARGGLRSFTRRILPSFWDLPAFALLLGAFVLVAQAGRETLQPLSSIGFSPISLDPTLLPHYALLTTLRMLAAILASLLFSLIYATLAAKSRRVEMVLIPLLDILQSVPVLGFLSFTVAGFMALFPGRLLGVECAAVFAIFTSQAWNMTFSLYQSLKTLPRDLEEVALSFRLSPWQRFWRLEIPFAMPGLIWNAMMSMSGGWFFVVAAEAISVGHTTIALPGIGSYVALAIDRRDLGAIGWALLTMLVIILIYDQLLFRPLVAWSEKFRFELSAASHVPESWFLDLIQRARLFRFLLRPIGDGARTIAALRLAPSRPVAAPLRRLWSSRIIDFGWGAAIGLLAAYALWRVFHFVMAEIGVPEIFHALGLGLITLLRVLVLIALTSLIWVPIGVWIGLRPRWAERIQPLAQFLAAFPANLTFPVAVLAIVRFQLDPDIWLSPLMVLGTQWYILFNVVAGASAFPNDLKEAAASFRIHGWHWWRQVILPGIMPYYLTGAITASGGCWNASIVAEIASWGDKTLEAHGLGAYIAKMTAAGDFPRLVLGIAVMSLFVVLLNRLFWRRLFAFAARNLRLD